MSDEVIIPSTEEVIMDAPVEAIPVTEVIDTPVVAEAEAEAEAVAEEVTPVATV